MPSLPQSDARTPGAAALPQLVAAFLCAFGTLAYIQFAGPDIVGTDGFYHIKVAELMRQSGVPVDFPWLQYTILDRDHYTDHHLLLHGFQVPFTALFTDLRLAAKWSAVTAAAVSFTVLVAMLWRYGVRLPLFWMVVLFAASSPFLYRMSMARGQSISLALQIIAFHLIMQRSKTGLFLLSAVFVWAYNGFPILIPLVAIGVIVHYLCDRTFDYGLVVAVVLGIGLGLLTHPYFPNDVLFLWNHIAPKLFAWDYATSVGKEWYPYSSWDMLVLSAIAVIAYLLALFINTWRDLIADKPRFFWLLATTLYFLLFLKSRRFVEYFPACAVILLALTTRHWPVWSDLGALRRNNTMLSAAVAVVAVLAAALVLTLRDVRADVRSQNASERYRGAALWLAANTPDAATVFHSDWDDFPKLFFFNTHNRYLLGLDPDFMRLRDETLFREWEKTTKGRSGAPDAVVEKFGAEYVFTDRRHRRFIRSVEKNPRFKQYYSDDYAIVYRLIPPPDP